MPTHTAEQPLTPAQLNMAARIISRFATYRWFEGTFNEEEAPYLVRLFLGVYVNYSVGRLPTQKEATAFMTGEHTKTTRKYLAVARRLGYLKVARSKRDRRKILVYPTDKMLALLEGELQALGQWLGVSVPEALSRKNAEAEVYPLVTGVPAEHAFSPTSHKLEEINEEFVVAETTEAIRLAPKNAMAFVRRSGAFARIGEIDKAIADLNQAIKLRPGEAHLIELRARHYWRQSKWDEALRDANEIVSLAPDWSAGYARRALVLWRLDRQSEAGADLLKAKSVGAHFRKRGGEGETRVRVEHEDGAFEELGGDIADWAWSVVSQSL